MKDMLQLDADGLDNATGLKRKPKALNPYKKLSSRLGAAQVQGATGHFRQKGMLKLGVSVAIWLACNVAKVPHQRNIMLPLDTH